jgi:hypothetical protein
VVNVPVGFGFLSISPASAQSGRYGNWHMRQWMVEDWEMGWFGLALMIIFRLVIIIGLALLIRWLIQNTRGKSPPGVTPDLKLWIFSRNVMPAVKSIAMSLNL